MAHREFACSLMYWEYGERMDSWWYIDDVGDHEQQLARDFFECVKKALMEFASL